MRKTTPIFIVCICFMLLICTATIINSGNILVFATKSIVNYENVGSSAECVAVLEQGSGRLLYGKNINRKRPMASTTKIATAITVLENCENLDKIVTVPTKAAGVEGSSIYLAKGEKVKVIDLLYGLMLQSGNDCAETLAITIGGSIEKFATLMNESAVKVGATNTNFTNPHGLHNDNHYTTAYDLAIITAHAMKNQIFKTIVSTKKHTMPWEGRNYPRIINNKNKILNTFDGGDGVKTGFTKKAGRCLVSSATRNDMQMISVVFNCAPMFEECSAFMEKAFNEFILTNVCHKFNELSKTSVENGKSCFIRLANQRELFYPLKKGELEKVRFELEPLKVMLAPIKEGQFAGNFKVYLDNQLLFSEKLITMEGVDSLSVFDKLKDLIADWNK